MKADYTDPLGGESPGSESDLSFSKDNVDLFRVGKRPVLKRNFTFFSVLSLSCTILICWEGILSTFSSSFPNGGAAGVFWGFIVIWVGTLSTFLSISELASMAPTSGGQYHWVNLLAPESSRKFFSYITGWMTFIGWQAAFAAGGPLGGGLVLSIVEMCNPSFVATGWQKFLISWAVYALAVSINVSAGKILANFESAIFVVHLVGFVAVLVPLVALGPHKSASEVFTTFLNEGEWSTQGVSFFVGLSSTVFVLSGADSAVHMAEEVRNASLAVPRALIYGLLINGTLGVAMIIAILFCLGPVDRFLDSKLPFPYIYVLQQAVGSNAGAAVMAAIPTSIAILGQVGTLATTSRQLWAFARDRGVPFWRHVSKVDKRTTMPLYAVGVSTAISSLLSLIVLGSDLVFNDIISIVVVGLYSSYLLVCSLLLWRRLQPVPPTPSSSSTTTITTGTIGTTGRHNLPSSAQGIAAHDPTADILIRPGQLMWGQWRVRPAWLGTANNMFAIAYTAVMLVWSFFPPETNPTPSTMSYACLVYGAVLIFSVVWYLLVGRKEYEGPIVEVRLDGEGKFIGDGVIGGSGGDDPAGRVEKGAGPAAGSGLGVSAIQTGDQ